MDCDDWWIVLTIKVESDWLAANSIPNKHYFNMDEHKNTSLPIFLLVFIHLYREMHSF